MPERVKIKNFIDIVLGETKNFTQDPSEEAIREFSEFEQSIKLTEDAYFMKLQDLEKTDNPNDILSRASVSEAVNDSNKTISIKEIPLVANYVLFPNPTLNKATLRITGASKETNLDKAPSYAPSLSTLPALAYQYQKL